jgi:c-di-GMP-binding flagellar brake protein YcgR
MLDLAPPPSFLRHQRRSTLRLGATFGITIGLAVTAGLVVLAFVAGRSGVL